jgi:hypothetical protein
VNPLKCEAETNRNAVDGGQGEVPPDRQASSKKAIVKRLLCVFVGVISSTAAICAVLAFVTQDSQSEKKPANTSE